MVSLRLRGGFAAISRKPRDRTLCSALPASETQVIFYEKKMRLSRADLREGLATRIDLMIMDRAAAAAAAAVVGRLLVVAAAWLGALSVVQAKSPEATLMEFGQWNPTWRIVSWGENAREWNRVLHLSTTRLGCSDPPASCISLARSVSRRQGGGGIFLSIQLRRATAIDYGAAYGLLSSADKVVESIGVDDFRSQYEDLFSNPPQGARISDSALILDQLISGMQARDPQLKFGITLYEDDLDSRFLVDPLLPATVRSKVDFVHLYLHFRANAPGYPDYVKAAAQLFNRAKIIAGVYAYDRISYLPCSPRAPQHCTKQREIEYFTRQLDESIRLLRSGDVAGIEFYPGQFGREEEWDGWNEPRICPAARRQECIGNTKAMRQIVAAMLP
jgi:hypothetical protein